MPEPRELKTFTTEALSDLQTTSAVVPSSRYLTRAMVAPLPLSRASCVVEFGPGTGVITAALLALMPRQARLLAFEVNPTFVNFLREKFPDPRLEVIERSAETLPEELQRRGIERVDAAASSLGLILMPDAVRHGILGGLAPFLGPESVYTQYVYVHGLLFYFERVDGHFRRFPARGLFARYFSRIERAVVWRNVPPAAVFSCRR